MPCFTSFSLFSSKTPPLQAQLFDPPSTTINYQQCHMNCPRYQKHLSCIILFQFCNNSECKCYYYFYFKEKKIEVQTLNKLSKVSWIVSVGAQISSQRAFHSRSYMVPNQEETKEHSLVALVTQFPLNFTVLIMLQFHISALFVGLTPVP